MRLVCLRLLSNGVDCAAWRPSDRAAQLSCTSNDSMIDAIRCRVKLNGVQLWLLLLLLVHWLDH